jgi:hypothetical protein
MSNVFPLDFEAINKGDVIPQSKIEQIYLTQYRADPKAYAFAQMKLCNAIRESRPDLSAHIRSRDLDIEVMSDEQAEAHTQRRFEQARRTIATNAVRRASIDRSDFDSAKKAVAETNDRIQHASSIELMRVAEQARRNALFGSVTTAKELKG